MPVSVRYEARLDAETHAKVEGLAHTLHRTCAAVLRHVLQWGLTDTHGWTIERTEPATVRTLHVLLDPALLQQVQAAARAQGTSIAAWLREAVRRVTPAAMPDRGRLEEAEVRSHDSPTYPQRFLLRLDEATARKLQALVAAWGKPRAAILRQLVAQATPEDVPHRWQRAGRERRPKRP
jgi:predicted transcriptional regulator